jgi:hypothetical protein
MAAGILALALEANPGKYENLKLHLNGQSSPHCHHHKTQSPLCLPGLPGR